MLFDVKFDAKSNVQELEEKIHRIQKHTIIFLDWNDTIISTEFLFKNKFLDASEQKLNSIRTSLNNCANAVKIFLQSIKNLSSHVYILTNAKNGWVEKSCSTFYPTLNQKELFNNIKIIYARNNNESTYPDFPMMWKLQAMTDILTNSTHKFEYVFSVGDSIFERSASYHIKRAFGLKAKIIKLLDETDCCEQLEDQLSTLSGYIYSMISSDEEFDLMMEFKTLDNKEFVTFKDNKIPMIECDNKYPLLKLYNDIAAMALFYTTTQEFY